MDDVQDPSLRHITDLEMSNRAYNVLVFERRLLTVSQVAELELCEGGRKLKDRYHRVIEKLGKTSVHELRQELNRLGLDFKNGDRYPQKLPEGTQPVTIAIGEDGLHVTFNLSRDYIEGLKKVPQGELRNLFDKAHRSLTHKIKGHSKGPVITTEESAPSAEI